MNLLDLYCTIAIKDEYSDGINAASKKFSAFSGKMKSGLATVAKAAGGISAAVGTASALIAKLGAEAAAEVRAETSAFEQTFGNMADTATDAIGRVANSSGILQTRLNTLGSKIYAFARSSGGDVEESMTLMERALQAAADSAAYYDTSVEQATETLQSFLKGNFANDAALGLSATETTRNAAAMELFGQKYQDLSEIQKQETLLKMVEDAQKLSGAMGQAAREADGWENVIGNLKESWRQLRAQFGEPFLDVVTPVIQNAAAAIQNFTAKVDWAALAQQIMTGFNAAVTAGQNLITTVQNLLPVIVTATGAFAAFKAGMAIQTAVQGFQKAQVAISLLTMEIGSANLAQAALNGTMTVGETIVALLTGKMSLAALGQAAMTKAQTALNAAMNANPIALVVTAIGALVTALVVAYNTNEDFRNKVNAAWTSIKETISNAVSSIKTFFTETIPNAGREMLEFFKGIPGMAMEWGMDLIQNFIDGIKAKISALKDTVVGVAQTVKDFLGFSEPKEGPLSNFHTYAPDMMHLFADGIRSNSGLLKSAFDDSLSLGNPQQVDFASSGLGRASAGTVNGLVSGLSAASESGGALTVNLVLPDGSKLASWVLPDLIKAANANGTPIAEGQFA